MEEKKSAKFSSSFRGIASFFHSLSIHGGKNLLVLVHKGADIDAIASAGAFYFLFSKKNAIKIVVPEHISISAKSFASKTGIPFSVGERVDYKKFDYVIVFDCSSNEMLPGYEEALRLDNLLVIDHHSSLREGEKNFFVQPKEVSSAIVLYKLLCRAKIIVDEKAACLLAAGIITDSAGFSTADHLVFSVLARLLKKANMPYAHVTELFRVEKDLSQKICALKAAKRCTIYNSFDFLIVTTEVGSFEAEAASALVRLGSDISFAAGVQKGNLILSARASQSFIEKNNFDIARHIFPSLEKQFGGKGGGHPAAASFNASAVDTYAVLQQCVRQTHMFLEDLHKKKKPIKEY